MKTKNKVLVVISYIAAFFGIDLIWDLLSKSSNTESMQFSLTSFIVLFVVMWVYSFLSGAIGLAFSTDKNKEVDYKDALLTKILMIPFFVVNFIIWLGAVGLIGVLSFMPIPGAFILGLPAVLIGCLAVTGTYVIMLSTSSGIIIPCIRKLIKREIRPIGIIGLILLFIFCVDAIGVFTLKISDKSNNNTNSPELKCQAN